MNIVWAICIFIHINDDEGEDNVDDFTGSASRGGEGLVRKLGDGNSPLNRIVTIIIITIIIINIIIIIITIITILTV